MAEEKEKPTLGASNIEHVKKAIKSAIPSVRKSDEARKAANDDRNATRQHLASLGIPKAAFDAALRYLNWDEDKRTGFDTAYTLVREVGGSPMRDTLFDYAEREDRKAAALRLHELKGGLSAEDQKFLDLGIAALGGFVDAIKAAEAGEPTTLKQASAASEKAVKASAKRAADRAEKTSAKKKTAA
jgi:hypothetical protein